jgi:dihydropteroate synthase
MVFAHRQHSIWQLRTRALELGRRTVVMGILNVTPDSFSDGGMYRDAESAIEAGLRMFAEGAGIVDVGGESTRPGTYAKPSPAEEADRVLPVLEGLLRERPDAVISIDTYHATTARRAVGAGAEIVNDVSGLLWDADMAEVCAALQCGVAVMHTRGRPEDWKELPALALDEVTPLVMQGLRERVDAALRAGIVAERIVVDPGLGFGKAFEENYSLLAHLDAVRALGYPVLAGVSRKGFLGRTLGALRGGPDAPAEGRGTATIAAMTAAILCGADVVRVHAVRDAVEAAAIADAVLEGGRLKSE